MATTLAENPLLDFESSRLAGALSAPVMAIRSGAALITGTGSSGMSISPIPSVAIGFSPSTAESWLSDAPLTLAWLWVAPATREAPKVSTLRRSKELRFREARQDLFKSFAGQWVCLEGETIVAHGSNVARVVEEARRRGVQVPYIFRVSDEPEGCVRMGL